MNVLQAGFARVNVTPMMGIPMRGYFKVRLAEGVLDDLEINALALACGETKMLLREYFGNDLYLLPLCAYAGDQCPIDLIRWVEPESDVNDPNINHMNPIRHKADPSMFDMAGLRKAGKRIANEVIDVYEETGRQEIVRDTVLEHRVNTVRLPLRRVTKTEYAEAQLQIRRYLEEHQAKRNKGKQA